MNRRIILVGSAAALSALAGAAWLRLPTGTRPLTIASARDALAKFQNANIKKSGAWNAAQVFDHLAQSVEFSMSGFPQSKSAVFQSTAGALAFAAFKAKGAMTHGLAEVIPGAPALDTNRRAADALKRLDDALAQFSQFQGALKPHFAYGALSKADYEAAHAMHVFNHLVEFSN
jgi:hypothetical protein